MISTIGQPLHNNFGVHGALTLVILAMSVVRLATAAGVSVPLSVEHLREATIIEAQEQSARWGIEPADWLRYRELMAGPRGVFSPDADPISVLGASASTETERNRYADMYVRMAFERTEADLKFTRAVSQAWRRNFPNQFHSALTKQTRKPTVLSAFAQVQRVALVVETDCIPCKATLQTHLATLKGQTRIAPPVDIFLRDSGNDDQALRDWVKQHDIPIALIRTKRVTINHGGQYASGPVPQVWTLRGNGQWTPGK